MRWSIFGSKDSDILRSLLLVCSPQILLLFTYIILGKFAVGLKKCRPNLKFYSINILRVFLRSFLYYDLIL